MQASYPVFLDVRERRVLVVGAGAVAVRKARGLLEAGAKEVVVVSPVVKETMPEGVTCVAREFTESDLEGVGLCFAATDRAEVNGEVVRACRARGIWVNRADRDGEWAGDFTVPAVLRTGAVTIAVSGGGSPKVAAGVRDEIAEKLDESWGAMGEVAMEIRQKIVAMTDLPQSRRAEMLRWVASRESLAAFEKGGKAGVVGLLGERFPELRGGVTW